MRKWLIFDLETAPLPREEIERWLPDWEDWTSDMFDPSSVKVGNYSPGNPKAEEKIEAARRKAEEEHFEEQREKRDKLIEKAALNPNRGWIFGAGIATPDAVFTRMTLDQSEEPDIINGIWDLFRDSRIVCNHNLLGFDLPFLIARSFALDIRVPFSVRNLTPWSGQRVYCDGNANETVLLDSMQVADKTISREGKVSLDWCAKYFNLPQKIDLEDKLPWDVALKDFGLALRYAEQDAVLTRDVAKKLQLID